MDVSGRKQVGSDDMSTDILCNPCKGVGEDENAVCYCTVCNDFLCDICTRSHRRAKVSKHHHLLDKDSMPKQKFLSSEESMCTKHNGKLVEYYCKIHGDCCCSVCATIEHKQCKVEYIDDIATDFEKSKEYTSLMSLIADLTQLLQNTKKMSLKKKDELEQIHVKFVSEVNKFRAEINQILDSLERITLMQAHTVRDNDTSSTESVSITCDAMIDNLVKMSSTMESQKKYKQQRQLVISAKKSQNQIKRYDSLTAQLNNQCTIRDYCFRPNETIFQSIKVVNSIGHLDDRKKENRLTQLDQKVMELEKLSAPCKSVSLKCVDEFNIQDSTDTFRNTCWVTGGVMLDNNMLVLADHNNSCVNVVDIYLKKMISCLQLPNDPWDIARVERDRIVVTCDYKLVFIQIGKTLSVVKELDIGGHCRGIVYTNNTFIVSYVSPFCVNILDLEGQLLKTISTDENRTQTIIPHPHKLHSYITLSTDQKTLYVSDCSNNSVTSMDLDGTMHHVYKHDKLKDPLSLAVDREGNIYIAGQGQNDILILSPQCTNIKTLQAGTWGSQRTHAVIYCERYNRLYISQSPDLWNHLFRTYVDNTVHVYQIE